MWSYWLWVSPGANQCSIGSKNHFVCSAEKVSVDMVKITPAHTIAGHHAHNHASPRGLGVFARISDKLGAGRGLRHGCESIASVQHPLFVSAYSFERRMKWIPGKTPPAPLFHAVIRRFLRDNHVVDVALAQSRRRHANEAALFLELFQRARAHIAHSAAQPANKLVGQ